MARKNGSHYRKRKDTENEDYSLRSLTEEITGIPESSQGFNAAYKAVQRIVGTFQSQEGVAKGKIKIRREEKQAFVQATKAFYEKEDFRDLLAKMKKKEDIPPEELDKLIDHFVASMVVGKSEEEKTELILKVELRKEEDYFSKGQTIKDIVMKDLNLADGIKDYPTKLRYMDQYIDILNKELALWRETLQNHIRCESAYAKIIQKGPHELEGYPLSEENITPEILTKIAIETLK